MSPRKLTTLAALVSVLGLGLSVARAQTVVHVDDAAVRRGDCTTRTPVGTPQSDAPNPRSEIRKRQSTNAAPTERREVPDDPYMPPPPQPPRGQRGRTRWTRGPYVSVQINVDELGDNIVGDAANEPSIAIDPVNPGRIVIGWRQFDNVSSNFRQAGWAYSHDAGQSWTFPGVLEPGVFRSDPVLDFDAERNFYYYSLQSDFTCQLFKSVDGGVSWWEPVQAFGGDKAWMAIDRTGGIGEGNIYCGALSVTRSTDGGSTFSPSVYVGGLWGTMTVDPNGAVYKVGRAVSDGAPVWESTNAQDPDDVPVFDFLANVDLGGRYSAFGGPNPGGYLGQPWIACDHSDGPNRGNVYLLASVNPPGDDPLDVMFARSIDGGLTWSAPVRVNDDPLDNGAWQWFGTMSVAPNGRIDAVWNDTRSTDHYRFSELHYTYSIDGGLTWAENVPVSPVFDSHVGWPQQDKIGDYYDMISDNVTGNLAYAATFNGEQDVYFLRVGDCNGNGAHDSEDVANGTSEDCNENGSPDECDPDCNTNGIPDECDITDGASLDCQPNGIPDECEEDCNGNAIPDDCDITDGTSLDCQPNGIPDECEADCNANGFPDECDITDGTSEDCNLNWVPDECDITSGTSADCQPNGIPDECDIDDGSSFDCNTNDVPDECDIANGTSDDCQPNGIPDECEPDCNDNGVADRCDIADGTSQDCNANDVPDECEPDCNENDVPDGCDIADGTSQDEDGNGIPDECQFPLFVDADARPGGDGLTWASGFNDLQAALGVAANSGGLVTEIRVAEGIYTPAGPDGDRTATFRLRDWLAIRGGYAGFGTPDPGKRDVVAYETVLSGDLNGDDDPGFQNNGENSYHVVYTFATDATAVLDGFTITSGNANGSSSLQNGAGMYNSGSATPTLINCTFSANTAPFLSGDGAGMYNTAGSSPTLINCTFTGNSAGGDGGGMLNHGSHPILINGMFAGNSATQDGGGIYNTFDSSPTLTNCAFIGNSAGEKGGGMYSIVSSPTLTGCILVGNTADEGAGIYNGPDSDLTLVACTLTANTANTSGGGMYNEYSDPRITNCILWGDTPDEVVADSGNPSLSYTDIDGGWPGEGNIDADPLFVDPDGPDDVPGTEDDNLRLSPGSPCINTGDPGYVPEPGETDLDGHARVLCERVDMGPYEFGIGDYDCDQAVDLTDFANWESCFTGPAAGPCPEGCEAFDFDFDSDVDLEDFGGFQPVFE